MIHASTPAGRSRKTLDLGGIDLDNADELAERLIAEARSQNLRIVTAESCTAGLIAHTLSRSAGSSAVLAGGFVTYTKEAKTRMLGVSPPLFERNGAVDADVAEAMACGARERSGADFAIAITGVTGSEPDEDGNPIGRIFIGLATTEEISSLHCELGRLDAPELTDLAIRAALLFALADLGDEDMRALLSERQVLSPPEA